MLKKPKKPKCATSTTAGSLMLALVLGLVSLPATATNVGQVTYLSGMLAVKRADGAVRLLGRNSGIQSGDTLTTEKDSYARIKFQDGGDITLRPNTLFRIEKYSFQGQPDQDNAFFSLVKGGLRAISGAIGKQNQSAYRMTTPTATIGIRGTHYGVLVCEADCGGLTNGLGQALGPGTYVDVAQGAIALTTQAGEQVVTTGQFGHAPKLDAPPVALPVEQAVTISTATQEKPALVPIEAGSKQHKAAVQECTVE